MAAWVQWAMVLWVFDRLFALALWAGDKLDNRRRRRGRHRLEREGA